MAIFLCPSCGKKIDVPEDQTSYKAMCTRCDKIVAVIPLGKSSSPRRKNSKKKKNKRLAARKKWILRAGAVGAAVAILFMLFGPDSKPPKIDLSEDELDQMIVAVGMRALETRGRTKEEAALYIETRIQVLKLDNKEARVAYRSGGLSGGGLKAKSTASDLKVLGKEELRHVYEEIVDRDNRIKQLGRILVDYRRNNPVQ